MSLVQINWKPTPRELRKFGVVLFIGFALIGALLHWAGHRPAAALGCWAFGAIAGALGLTGTPLALPLYWAWMGVAFVMGHIMSRVLLTVFYYGMITPVGWLMRLLGRDKLMLRRKPRATYWQPVAPPPAKAAGYERQF